MRSFDNVTYATIPWSIMNNQPANATFQGAAVPKLPTLPTTANTTQWELQSNNQGPMLPKQELPNSKYLLGHIFPCKNLCSDDTLRLQA
jgi:hypothetical protein